jgi:hypothetical protein
LTLLEGTAKDPVHHRRLPLTAREGDDPGGELRVSVGVGPLPGVLVHPILSTPDRRARSSTIGLPYAVTALIVVCHPTPNAWAVAATVSACCPTRRATQARTRLVKEAPLR